MMIRPTQYPLISRAALLALLAVLLPLAGCSSSKSPASAASFGPSPEAAAADQEFESGTHRPPSPQTLYALAKILATQDKDAQAVMVLTRIISEHPDFLPAYCDLAEAQMRQRHIEEAMSTLSHGLAISPRQPVLINDMGMCQMTCRHFQIAAQSFAGAVALAPDDARYRANLAAALGMLGRYEESLALYLEILPNSDAHYNLAVLCDARHDRDRATREYQAAAALQSDGTDNTR